jgi:hypothetical protein
MDLLAGWLSVSRFVDWNMACFQHVWGVESTWKIKYSHLPSSPFVPFALSFGSGTGFFTWGGQPV